MLLTLTCAGALGGAVQGVLSADVYPRGDAFVWDRIEACTEFFATAGLAAGIALALVRHVAARLVLALLLGMLAESLRLLVRRPELYFPGDGGSGSALDLELLEYQLLLGAPVAAAMALSAHATRTMATSVPGALAALLLSGILGMQSYSPRDLYDLVSSLKDPWQNFAHDATFLPSRWKGGLLLGLIVAVSMYGLELLSIVLRDRGKARWTGVLVAAACVCFFVTLVSLCSAMPLTPASGVCALAFAEDGRHLVTAHEGQTLRLWSLEENKPNESPTIREIRKVRLSVRPNDQISMAGDGQRVLVASQSGRIVLWKASTLNPLDEVEYVDQNFHAPSLSGDGRFLAVLHGVDEIWLWRSGERERPLQEPPLVLVTGGLSFLAASFSPDGGFLLAQDGEGDSAVWDAATGDRVWRRGDLDRDAAGPEPGLLFGPRPDAQDLTRILGDERALAIRSYFTSPHATSPDGRHTVFAREGDVYRWDNDSTTPLRIYRELAETVGALAYSSDGRHIAAGNEYGQVRFVSCRR